MEHFHQFRARAEIELNKIDYLNKLEKQTKIPKFFLVGGVVSVCLALAFLNIGASLIANMVGFVYPAYASFKAIESADKDDDKLWLTYWVIYAFFNVLEYFADWLLFWLPFYFVLKIVFLYSLFSPTTRGAVVLYDNFIRQFLIKHEATIDRKAQEYKDKATKQVNEIIDKTPGAKENIALAEAVVNKAAHEASQKLNQD